MKKENILIVGTVAIDDIKSPMGKRNGLLGGSAVYASLAARFLSRPEIIAPVGYDFPDKYLSILEKKRIDVSSVERLNGDSFKWSGSYDCDFCNATTLNTRLGVLEVFSPRLSSSQRKAKFVFLANIDPDIQMSLLRSLYSPKIVAIDTMNFWINNKPKQLKKVLSKADVMLANEEEVKSLSGERFLLKAAKSVKKLGIKIVVVKKGEHGVFLYSDRYMFFAPAYPLEKVVDPTGAGDSFAGAFLSYLAARGTVNEKTFKEALFYSCVMASFTVEDFGTAPLENLTAGSINKRKSRLKKMLVGK
jgi:hypothetical protein